MDIHISLIATALAALINVWLAVRCVRMRFKAGVHHGDGGDALLLQRMRAHSNFVEYTPFALLLILGLELTGHGGWLLAMAALAFLLGRVLHALGMDAEKAGPLRQAGVLATFSLLILLAVAALLAAFRMI